MIKKILIIGFFSKYCNKKGKRSSFSRRRESRNILIMSLSLPSFSRRREPRNILIMSLSLPSFSRRREPRNILIKFIQIFLDSCFHRNDGRERRNDGRECGDDGGDE